MDAKPQRPRILRPYDENMPPPALPGKTLHQRTKSVPAFSSVLGAKSLLATKKILGEANANKIFQPAKDDLVLGKKVELDVKPAPLARPASRPFSAKSTTALPVQEPAKKLIVKKSTKVLKDAESAADNVKPQSVIVNTHAIDSSVGTAEVLAPASVTTAATSQELPVHTNAIKDVAFEATRLPPSEPITRFDMKAPIQYYDQYEFTDEDYTTALSFNLRGDSLGGATTTIVAPKETDKSKLEVEAAKLWVASRRTEEDIDDEEWDTSMVAEYSEEIFAYMRELEDRMVPNPRYMDIQTEIQWSMRAVLIDWVVQVHQRFNLLPETLFLSVNYIDRFLTFKVVSLGKLQLVGATALFIAAKFEEVNCPTLQEIIFMVDGGYSIDELLKAERFMLSMLQFDLGWPGPMSFLRRVSKADDYDLETRTVAKYFLEVVIMDERFVGCTPSYLAAGAHCMARLILGKGEWTVAHVAYSGYTYAQLRHLLNGIWECCEHARKHHLSVYEKYTDKRYKHASVYVEMEIARGFTLQPHPFRSINGITSTTAHCMPVPLQ